MHDEEAIIFRKIARCEKNSDDQYGIKDSFKDYLKCNRPAPEGDKLILFVFTKNTVKDVVAIVLVADSFTYHSEGCN